MELFAFRTDGVEYKLYDILSAFNALSFAVNGLRYMDRIKEDELFGFEYILKDAIKKAELLVQGMKPILVNNDERIVLLLGTQVKE
ncbi:MAG TPA: hypothetical protein PK293_17960 [Spirochaetota bacterium]|nr:hypothetical protein [Spirochaetota bacterium]